DKDLHERLQSYGLTLADLHPHTAMFHQWHATFNYGDFNFPHAFYSRILLYMMAQRGIIIRNPQGWGHLTTSADRPILPLIENQQYEVLAPYPYNNDAIAAFDEAFYQLPSGGAVAVAYADAPHPNYWQ